MKIDYLDDPNQNVHIEILPLIDVIFCILTFFILAAVGLTRQQAIDLDLPAANTGAPLPAQA
jgi:biopolymer transport protein ExbD